MKENKFFTKLYGNVTKGWIINRVICSIVMIALIAAVNIGNSVADTFALQLTAYLCPPIVDNSAVDKAQAAASELAKEVELEGATLLKNDNVLPLSKTDDKKVNVFGYGSVDWVYGGIGNGCSGQVRPENDDINSAVDLIKALKRYGISTNTEIQDFYKSWCEPVNLIKNPNEIHRLLEETVSDMLRGGEELDLSTTPSIILVIGVNGVGKTTTIGKLANHLTKQGKKVILAAGDTFRAAAIEQLEIWADRSHCEIIKQNEGSDPAAVIYDAISAAKARHADVIICDTAGRLHNKKPLMDELAKINRIIDRELPDASKEKLLVLDATTGQNAVNQAEQFSLATGITGIVLTKLDGTAKGGVVLAIKEGLGIPVKYIGVGEQIDDLQPFDAEDFARALFVQN